MSFICLPADLERLADSNRTDEEVLMNAIARNFECLYHLREALGRLRFHRDQLSGFAMRVKEVIDRANALKEDNLKMDSSFQNAQSMIKQLENDVEEKRAVIMQMANQLEESSSRDEGQMKELSTLRERVVELEKIISSEASTVESTKSSLEFEDIVVDQSSTMLEDALRIMRTKILRPFPSATLDSWEEFEDFAGEPLLGDADPPLDASHAADEGPSQCFHQRSPLRG